MTMFAFNPGDSVCLPSAKNISGEVVQVYVRHDGKHIARVQWSTNEYGSLVDESQAILESYVIKKESEPHFMQPAIDLVDEQIRIYELSITATQEKIEDLIRIKNDLMEL